MKNKNLVHLTRSKEIWSVSYITCIEIIAQISLISILFLDALTLKRRIIIIILPTNRPEILLTTARITKTEVTFALLMIT